MKGIDNEILLFRVQGALGHRVKTSQRHKCQKLREGRLLLEGSSFRSRRRLIIKLCDASRFATPLTGLGCQIRG